MLDLTTKDRVRKGALFAHLSDELFQEFVGGAKVVTAGLGSVVQRQDAPSEALYVLVSGRVRLLDEVANHEEATIESLCLPGDHFGEESVYSQGVSTFSVRASSQSTLLRAEPDLVRRIASGSEEFRLQLEQAHRSRLQAMAGVRAGSRVQDQPAPAAANAGTVASTAANQLADATKARTERIADETLVPRLRRVFRKYPFVPQQSAMDCGAACLGMICSFYGKKVNMNYIRDLADVGRQGTSLLALSEAAEGLGFMARGLKATYGGLSGLKPPLICHWQGNHFVVVYDIKGSRVIVGDPARDVMEIDRGEFSKSFTSFAIELLPTGRLGEGAKSGTTLGRFVPMVAPYKKLLIDILVASLIYQVLTLAMPLFTQVVVDKVLLHQSVSMLNVMLLGMVVLSLFQTAISSLRAYLLAYTYTKVDQALLSSFYRHVLSLPLRFFEQRKVGDVVTRFAENAKIRDLLTQGSITILLDVLMAVVYLTLIFAYNVTFAVCVLVYLSLFSALAIGFTPILKSISRRTFDKEVASSSFLIESLHCIERIKSGAAEHRIRWKWEELFADTLNIQLKGAMVERGVQTISELIQLAGSVLLLWFGANLVIGEQITIGQLMALNMMVGRVSDPIMRLIGMWQQLQETAVALERLGDVLEAQPEQTDGSAKIVLSEAQGSITFDNVTFSYSSHADKNTLQNVSFEAVPGQLVALVGRSGSGKSTLLRLIQGLYLPTSGRVLIDGHDLTHVSLPSLRSQIGTVLQSDQIMSGTIRENLIFNEPDASMEKVMEVADIAGIHEFIRSQPSGYETVISEGGSNLSGGQRQRLAIARALLHRPKILILDEATSFLDSESERHFQDGMNKFREGRTVFVAAHRLATIRSADLILVLDRGIIVERGTHESLTSERGLYYYLCSQQLAV